MNQVHGHFYRPDGTCLHGLREARKFPDSVPSPTTVLKLLSSPALVMYLQRQMHKATLSTLREPDWDDDTFYDKCVIAADEHSQKARDKGGDVHDEIQAFHRTLTRNPYASPQAQLYYDWFERFVDRVVLCEEVVMGDGYGGRLDVMVQLKDGRTSIIDAKTQDTSKKKGRFNVYSQWGLQLGAYAGAVTPRPDVLMSICLSSNEPAVLELHTWPQPPQVYTDLFMGLLRLWCFHSNFYPAPQAPTNAPGSIMSPLDQGTLC